MDLQNKRRARDVLLSLAALLPMQLACSPYLSSEADFYAGPVDPKGFADGYVGVKGYRDDRPSAIAPHRAYVGGKRTFFYAFNFPVKEGREADPFFIPWDEIMPTYVYEAPGKPLPASQRCTPPKGYSFDPIQHAYSQQEQGAVFTRLPSDAKYRPVVAEVSVSAANQPCQSEKSARLVHDHHQHLLRSGRLLMWPIIDPGTDVLLPDEVSAKTTPVLPPESARSPQYFGWYQQRLLAYLDGGAVPYSVDAKGEGARLEPQKLFYPSVYTEIIDGKPQMVKGRPGAGHDVLEYPPGHPDYSPVCQVYSFVPRSAEVDETDVDKIRMLTHAYAGFLTYCVQLAAKD